MLFSIINKDLLKILPSSLPSPPTHPSIPENSDLSSVPSHLWISGAREGCFTPVKSHLQALPLW